ncbi:MULTISPECIES: PH domain-containing protein [Cellulomonas]|uniref:PH domain-containing protein n=1 Tax=Cellulomonas TaxID=1707 RepID=UPI001CA42D02|nr:MULTISPECIES: PH domain-containing protein [Cellulomonas]
MGADRATRIVLSHRLLRRYVLPGERVVLATRRHWAKLLEPALTALAVLVAVAWLTARLEPALGEAALWLWWLWLAALARLGWLVLVWRVEWFVATDKRMLLLTGLVTHQIGMMPLMKVTDMRYSRSVLGQLLGYGQFLLESAGQDQALRSIDWVARPDATYRDLCALIFTPVDGSGDVDDAPARGLPRPRPPAVPPSRWPARTPAGGTRAGEVDTQPIGLTAPPSPVVHAPAPDPRPGAAVLPPTLAEAAASPLAVEAEAIAGEDALRRAEEDAQDRSWDVSEPTATFVRLEPGTRTAPSPPARPARPAAGKGAGEDDGPA